MKTCGRIDQRKLVRLADSVDDPQKKEADFHADIDGDGRDDSVHVRYGKAQYEFDIYSSREENNANQSNAYRPKTVLKIPFSSKQSSFEQAIRAHATSRVLPASLRLTNGELDWNKLYRCYPKMGLKELLELSDYKEAKPYFATLMASQAFRKNFDRFQRMGGKFLPHDDSGAYNQNNTIYLSRLSNMANPGVDFIHMICHEISHSCERSLKIKGTAKEFANAFCMQEAKADQFAFIVCTELKIDYPKTSEYFENHQIYEKKGLTGVRDYYKNSVGSTSFLTYVENAWGMYHHGNNWNSAALKSTRDIMTYDRKDAYDLWDKWQSILMKSYSQYPDFDSFIKKSPQAKELLGNLDKDTSFERMLQKNNHDFGIFFAMAKEVQTCFDQHKMDEALMLFNTLKSRYIDQIISETKQKNIERYPELKAMYDS